MLVLLVALSPTLFFGQSLSAFGLILTGASLLVVRLRLRWGGGAGARTLGTILVIVGVVILALAVGVTALLLAGWDRALTDLPDVGRDELGAGEALQSRLESVERSELGLAVQATARQAR